MFLNPKNSFFLVVTLFILGCPPRANDGPPRPIEPPDTNLCEAGCENLKNLGCEEAQGSDSSDPDSCKNDCEYIQKEGGVSLNPKCWVSITDCLEIEITCRK